MLQCLRWNLRYLVFQIIKNKNKTKKIKLVSKTLGIYYMLKITFSLSGWCSWGSHSQLPAGEVPRGPPEPRRKKLPYILPAGGRRRRRSAPLAWSREKLQALPLLGAGQGNNALHSCCLYPPPPPKKLTSLLNFLIDFFRGIVPKSALSMIKVTGRRYGRPCLL